MFPIELEQDAFLTENGEFGWTREQIPLVLSILRSHSIGILGGELWWVRDGIPGWAGLIPQKTGPPGVYRWTTERRPHEPWSQFVERGASDAPARVERWPTPEDLPPDLPGRILYNLTWVCEAEFENLSAKAV